MHAAGQAAQYLCGGLALDEFDPSRLQTEPRPVGLSPTVATR
ncbi:hypothetical protein [Streptomyces sp. NPDC047706]